MRDLAPSIYRQRLVVEGTRTTPLLEAEIKRYLNGLSDALDMVTLQPAVTHHSRSYGWAAWIHWETSGAHFYAWDEPTPFFSVDIYTCKPFEPQVAVDFTQASLDAIELVSGP